MPFWDIHCALPSAHVLQELCIARHLLDSIQARDVNLELLEDFKNLLYLFIQLLGSKSAREWSGWFEWFQGWLCVIIGRLGSGFKWTRSIVLG